MNLVRITQQASILASIISTSLLIHIDLASAQQKTCVITDEGTTVCGKPTTQIKKSNQNSTYRKEVNNFIFILKNCSKLDTNVKCDFTITNKGLERELVIYTTSSKLVDPDGKSHYAYSLDFDSRVGDTNYSPRATIVPGVDYAATLNFKNMQDKIARFQLLEISTNGKSVQFRNFPISE